MDRLSRFCVPALSLALAAAVWSPASGQPVQQQFTPPPPIVPLQQQLATPAPIPGVASPVPSPSPGDVTPQVYVPPRSVRPLRPRTPRYVQAGPGRIVTVPPVPPHSTYSTRLHNCMQAGFAAGVPASRIGTFGARCAAQ